MSKEQAARQAPIPPPQFMRDIARPKEEDIEPGTQRDRMIAEFSQSDMWRHLKGVITRYQKQLARKMKETSKTSNNMAEIGALFMTLDVVNDFAMHIITHIDRVPEVLDKAREKDQGKNGG